MPEEIASQETITLTKEQFEAMLQQVRAEASAPITPPWLRAVGRYVGARLAEPSTYAGITLAVSAFGGHIDPEKFQVISQLGAILAGGILAVSKDTGSSV